MEDLREFETKNKINYTRPKDNKKESQKAWLFFIYFWLIFGVGTFLGSFIPIQYIFPINIAILIIIIITLFSKVRVGAWLGTILSVLLGIVSYSAFIYYLQDLGLELFTKTVLVAIAGFIVTGLLGYFVFKDVSNWGKTLFVVLVSVIVMMVVGLFIKMTLFHLIVTVIALGLFLMYNIYDFNRLRNGKFGAIELGFSLFINLLNIVIDLLRLVSILKD